MVKIDYDLSRIKSEFYEVINGTELQVDETSDSGKAKVTVIFDSVEDREFIRLLQETNTSWLAYTKNSRCADGVIIEISTLNQSQCKIYIMELKRTINPDKWTTDVRAQFRGATLRALSFLSSLGIRNVTEIEYFTGFVHSDMEDQIRAIKAKKSINPTSPIAKKNFLGVKETETLEWEAENITIFGNDFTHHKINLILDDNVGVGSVHI
ncbi:hypothetical protein [Paenibacillus sp. NRS-1781]|uniref:hypothetical protein n=1 Tax=unclassified Paenibacillus TaxID=185978 RepID=UPI003D2C1290